MRSQDWVEGAVGLWCRLSEGLSWFPWSVSSGMALQSWPELTQRVWPLLSALAIAVLTAVGKGTLPLARWSYYWEDSGRLPTYPASERMWAGAWKEASGQSTCLLCTHLGLTLASQGQSPTCGSRRPCPCPGSAIYHLVPGQVPSPYTSKTFPAVNWGMFCLSMGCGQA